MELRVNIETILERWENFKHLLETGEDNAKTADELYHQYCAGLKAFDAKYTNPGAIIKKESFARKIRLLSEVARRNGFKIVHSDKGYFICDTEEEWQKFLNSEVSRASSILIQLSKCEQLEWNEFLKKKLFKQKEKTRDNSQIMLEYTNA